ncbi:MAG: signal peptidase II [Candidatus Kryptoniota bacterium]
MLKIPKYFVALLLISMLIGCDQKTKSIAKHDLQLSNSIQYLGGLVQLQFAENEGGFLGIGSGLTIAIRKSITIMLTITTFIGLIALLLSAPKIKMPTLIAFSSMIAGAFGNSIDRLLNQGRVVDFIILGTDTIHTGIFNVADASMMFGIFMLIVAQLSQPKSAV